MGQYRHAMVHVHTWSTTIFGIEVLEELKLNGSGIEGAPRVPIICLA